MMTFTATERRAPNANPDAHNAVFSTLFEASIWS